MATNTDAAAGAEQQPPVVNAPIMPQAPVVAAPRGPPRERRLRRNATVNPISTASAAPALLELASVYSMRTVQRDSPNTFVPCSQMMFHVLGICDHLMVSTENFTHSCPAWFPLVSQLYMSMLWITHVIKVQVNAGFGAHHRSLLNDLIVGLNIDECMIPGPLVPFFQAITATNGPYEWSGDIIPTLPTFMTLWQSHASHVNYNFVRQVPNPAILLDQLGKFALSPSDAYGNPPYATFRWFDNVFNVDYENLNSLVLLGPHNCGSIYTPRNIFASAKHFWERHFHNFVFNDMNNDDFYNYHQFLGLQAITNEAPQTSWFLQVSLAMQKYCRYFSGSTTLASILPTGLGASAIYGTPVGTTSASRWFYPRVNRLRPFLSSRLQPTRAIPDDLLVIFKHSDFEVEEQAEQYAILTHTNVDWSNLNSTIDEFDNINQDLLRTGRYWDALTQRTSDPLNFANQFRQMISTHYHNLTGLQEN